ncbi:MAG: hypothetical protein A2V90_01750 [Gammaproteobacteria bacterium RBG_16_57_12]|nr:MAG: hypothetical protein A2V90_01750 [Gammaproteobacteria bacterium RBG_16_57_12]
MHIKEQQGIFHSPSPGSSDEQIRDFITYSIEVDNSAMTHYMELLATNQPWNLIKFMVVPVVLAETVAITELYILFSRRCGASVAAVCADAAGFTPGGRQA